MLHASRVLTWSCVAFLVSSGYFSLQSFPPRPITLVLLLIIAAAFFLRSEEGRGGRLFGWLTLAVFIAALRIYFLPQPEINFTTQEVTLRGTVRDEPVLFSDHQQWVFRTGQGRGDTRVDSPLYPRFQIDDAVEMTCTLRAPEVIEGFNYPQYLARHHIVSLCTRPSILSVTPGATWKSKLFTWKSIAMQRLQQSIPAPENGILLGVLFGMGHALPEQLETAFQRVGATHLLVISGSNVVLLSSLVLKMMTFFPISKRRAVVCAIGFLSLYALLTGLQPPAVRATVFGSISLFATLVGRRSDALRLLILVATLMVAWNPLLLFYDAGFQLSFLATAGMILLVSAITARIEWVPDVFELRTTMATTTAALLATTPLILFSFGLLSVVALPANLILVPLMNFVMIGGLVAVVITVILPASVATWICLPLYFLLHLTVQIVEWFAQWSFASIEISAFPLWMMVVSYIALGVLAWRAYEE